MYTTELDAVNACLSGIGAAIVDDINEPNLDIETARMIIERVRKQLLTKGWWFNKEPNVFLTPDATTGNITIIESNVLDIYGWQASRNCQFAIRGSLLYDTYNSTFDHRNSVLKDGTIQFMMIGNIPFDGLPEPARNYITYAARRMFAQEVEGDAQKYRFNQFDEQEAYQYLESVNARQRKHNIVNQNPTVQNFMARAGGQNARYFVGASGFPRRTQY